MKHFYPRPLRGGRHKYNAKCTQINLFLSTPSARRATLYCHDCDGIDDYFYPRPLRGGRQPPLLMLSIWHYFYPRPLRGGRRSVVVMSAAQIDFYPRPLRGGRHIFSEIYSIPAYFYPRPLRGGRPVQGCKLNKPKGISIHALCEEGDAPGAFIDLNPGEISIHALCEEGDPLHLCS